MTIFSEEARQKVRNGKECRENVERFLKSLKSEHKIREWHKGKGWSLDNNLRKEGFAYKEEFCPHFVLETLDEKLIFVFVSSSFRNCRRKISYYDMDGIKAHPEISKNIVSSIFLIGKSEKSFTDFCKRTQNGEQYCPFDLVSLVEEFYDDFLSEFEDDFELQKELKEDPAGLGSTRGRAGYQYERELVKILNNANHLLEYKRSKRSSTREFNEIIQFICHKYCIEPSRIKKIEATDTIPRLRTGGPAKTDIACKVISDKGTISTTFSVKKTTSGSQISCHERTAEDFLKVLELDENDRLAQYITGFEKGGSEKGLQKKEGFSRNEFHKVYEDHREKLAQWALKGQHEPAHNLTSPDLQIAENIFIKCVDNDKLICEKLDDHIKGLMVNKIENTWDVFGWTYPSKRRGKRIQLKLKLKYFRS